MACLTRVAASAGTSCRRGGSPAVGNDVDLDGPLAGAERAATGAAAAAGAGQGTVGRLGRVGQQLCELRVDAEPGERGDRAFGHARRHRVEPLRDGAQLVQQGVVLEVVVRHAVGVLLPWEA